MRNAKQNSSSGARVTESEENTGVANIKESRMKMLFVNLFIAEVSIELSFRERCFSTRGSSKRPLKEIPPCVF